MKIIIAIYSIALSRLSKSALGNFLQKVKALIAELNLEEIPIKELKLILDGLLDKYTNLNARSFKSFYTQIIFLGNKTRDKYVKFLLKAASNARRSPKEEEVTAAEKLLAIISPFYVRDLCRLSIGDKTDRISDLLHAIDNDEAKALITTLSLTNAVISLRAANGEVNDAVKKRTEERTAMPKDPNKEIRKSLMQCYRDIINRINACYLLGQSNELNLFINKLNQIIIETKNDEAKKRKKKKSSDNVKPVETVNSSNTIKENVETVRDNDSSTTEKTNEQTEPSTGNGSEDIPKE